VSINPPTKDIYDLMPPNIGPAQRRHNQERLARLEAEGEQRRARLALVLPGLTPGLTASVNSGRL
jgi:hypothetical protein